MTRTALFLAVLATSALAAPKRVLVAALPAGARLVEATLGKTAVVVRQEPLSDDLEAAALVELTRTSAAAALIRVRGGISEDLISVFNGLDGAPLLTLQVKHPKKGSPRVLPKALAVQLQRAVASSRPPKPLPRALPVAAREPAPAAREPAQLAKEAPPSSPGAGSAQASVAEAPAAVAPPAGPGPTIVRVGIGARTFQRSLKWTDDLFQRMPTYEIPLAPAAVIDAEFYPFAIAGGGSALARLGAIGSFEQSIGLHSTDAEGQRFETNQMRFRAGVQYSQPISILTVRVGAGWSMQSFTFSPVSASGAQKVNIPNVRYGAIRAALGLGVRLFGPLSLEVGGGYQYVLTSGEIASASYFSRARTGGADFTANLTWRVIPNLEARLGAEYQRYWLSLNPQPGDPWIAGGALDEYKSLHLSLAWVL